MIFLIKIYLYIIQIKLIVIVKHNIYILLINKDILSLNPIYKKLFYFLIFLNDLKKINIRKYLRIFMDI